jgi:hypothetical protein
VRNRAAPEGSVAEGYLTDEMLTFCSRYLENAPTIHNRPQRNLNEARGGNTSKPRPTDIDTGSSIYYF